MAAREVRAGPIVVSATGNGASPPKAPHGTVVTLIAQRKATAIPTGGVQEHARFNSTPDANGMPEALSGRAQLATR